MALFFEETRQILENRFFFGEDGTGSRNTYDFSIFLEGRQFTQPTKGDWIVVSIDDAGAALRGYSDNLRKTSGTVRFKISVRHGKGTKRVREIADIINNVMSFTAGNSNITVESEGTLLVHAGTLRKISDDDDGYLNYVIDFPYDYYTS